MSNVTRMPNVSPQNWPQQNWGGCSCGCNPCQCGGGLGGLMQCWQDIAQFQQFLQCMLSQAGPIPLQGVTDGSDAKPGFIGEFMTVDTQVSIPATGQVTINISPIVISPGDWDISAFMAPSVPVNFMGFVLSPVPAGMSNKMQAQQGTAGVDVATVASPVARGSFTVPTLLPFAVTFDMTTANVAGYAIFTVSARRRR
jgi:hypothetical protein